jgi:cytochrome oxidase assembly protein ShyY1
MSATAKRPRGVFGMTIIALVMVGVLASLGVWQLQRRDEKHALIAALTERLALAPVPLPTDWTALSAARDEFRRVTFTATFESKPDVMVYTSGSAVREDVAGPGTWAFLPARLPDGRTLVVNAGFVPNTMQDRAQQDRAVAPLITGAPVVLTGYLRFPEKPGLFSAHEDRAKRLWFVRDHQAMSEANAWGATAPFYIDLEAPVPPSGVPKPGPLQVHLRDNHMQYAITWFGLALVVLIAFGFWLAGQRRARLQP